ncbi:MAG TPA: hypothetical protein VN634_09100 [Candidatus Limnocylindrales bacterium]|nr:hypothetical protein [Candidatus Limnocylindrales bacterium]
MMFATVSLGVALAWVVLEVSLRLAPQVISPRLLILFEPGLRAEIAAGAFPLEKDYRRIERDDEGPPLFVAKPESPIVSVDNAAGNAPRSTDEIGFCNPPGKYAARDGIDVISVGDSFTWCHALLPAQTWTELLERRTGLSSFDLGLGGLGPYEYLQILREFGLAKHPRVVIMNVYGGNDLRDAVEYERYRSAVEAGGALPSEGPQPIAPALAASVVGRHSYALNLILALVSRVASPSEKDPEKAGVDFHYSIDGVDGPIPFNLENRDRDEVAAARRFERGVATPELWAGALSRFGALAREHGFLAVVSYTPSAHTIYSDHLRFADPTIEPVLRKLDDAQRAWLAGHADADGYVFHDLTPELRSAAANPRPSNLLYDPTTMHFSARGHEVVAEAFAGFLADRGISGKK